MFLNVLLSDPVLFFRIVVIVIMSVTLHELAHGLMALQQGDNTPQVRGHMTLNPVTHMGWPSLIFLCIAGIAWGQMPVNPSKFRNPKLGNMLVAGAGPALNLTLGILFVLLIKLSLNTGLDQVFSTEFFYLSAHLNFMLFLFNLLPIPPLDGFHVFSEMFPSLKPMENSPFAMFALMVLFLMPGFGELLSKISSFMINAFIF